MAKIKSQKKKKEQQSKPQEEEVVVLPSTRSSDDPIPNKVSSLEFHLFHCNFCKRFSSIFGKWLIICSIFSATG